MTIKKTMLLALCLATAHQHVAAFSLNISQWANGIRSVLSQGYAGAKDYIKSGYDACNIATVTTASGKVLTHLNKHKIGYTALALGVAALVFGAYSHLDKKANDSTREEKINGLEEKIKTLQKDLEAANVLDAQNRAGNYLRAALARAKKSDEEISKLNALIKKLEEEKKAKEDTFEATRAHVIMLRDQMKDLQNRGAGAPAGAPAAAPAVAAPAGAPFPAVVNAMDDNAGGMYNDVDNSEF